MSLWSYKNDFQHAFINYHFNTVNIREFSATQQYILKELIDEVPIDSANSIPLNYKLSDHQFEQVIAQRRSYPDNLDSGMEITKELLSRFCQIALIGNKDEKRNYPSGGSIYPVNIYIIFNSEIVEKPIFNENVGYIHFKEESIKLTRKVGWNQIVDAFLPNTPIKSAKFLFALTVDLENISKKYMDISYKLVQQEAGHIGQNIQLTAQYLGLRSIPLQGYNDIELARIIGNRQTVLSTILLG